MITRYSFVIKLFQPSVAFHIETSHLFCSATLEIWNARLGWYVLRESWFLYRHMKIKSLQSILSWKILLIKNEWKTPNHFLSKIFWTLDVSRTASYEITLVCLSICPSLSFLKMGTLVFTDIVVHDDCWPWYLVTDEARFLGGPNLDQMGQNRAWN